MTAKEKQEIAAMIAAAVAGAAQPEPEQEKPATRKPATRKTARKGPKVAASCITAGIAWNLLGADEQYKPRDMDKPATNAQLWNLNAKGLLSITQ